MSKVHVTFRNFPTASCGRRSVDNIVGLDRFVAQPEERLCKACAKHVWNDGKKPQPEEK